MDAVRTLYGQGVAFFDLVRKDATPRTRNWLLVHDSPIYVWLCSAVYLIFVWLGPKIMRNRKPFDLANFMVFYNAMLIVLSVYIVVEVWYNVYRNKYNLICQPYTKEMQMDPSELRMAQALWWYFFSKLIEFMDTVLMVLRKKNDQITFLHIFHHVSMLNIWWFSIMLIPGGQSWFASSINSLVHVFMYTYYLLNLFPRLRKYLWWKRYITQFQLIQFVLILLNTSYVYFSGCDFPEWSSIMLISYMFIMLLLFGNFYCQAYIKGKRLKPLTTEAKNETMNGTISYHDKNFNVKSE